jgi:phage terminase large subunit
VKPDHGQLNANQQEHLQKIIGDPVLFASHLLGVALWKRQIEILRSIQTRRRTAIKACHAAGKTFTLAIATLWWLTRYSDGIVLTTSSTQRQVKTQLWNEIHRLAANAKVPYPPLRTTELKLRGENNFALGFATNQTENFQGYHGKHILLIADEASGIESGIWDAIAGIMAGGMVHVVMAGNPITRSGAFFAGFTSERELWNCITIDALETPNLKGLTLEQLLALDPVDGGPLDQNAISYLVTRRWVRDQHLIWWHGSESSSPQWMSRVRAQFPDQSQNSLIRLRWLERAKERARHSRVAEVGSSPLVAGVDVGGGEAETVVYVCECRYEQTRIIAMGAWRGEDTRGQVVGFLNGYRPRLSVVRVDSIGIGHNFAKHLRDHRFVVDPINVGMPCESQPNLGENDPARRFFNLKARYYQTLADGLERDQIDGLNDEATIGQLANIQYEIDSHGRLRIESKEEARKRGASSFDRADALMLALCKPYQKFEWYSLRDRQRRQSKSAGPRPREIGGFFELGDDDGVDEHDPWAGWVGKARWPRGRGCW